RSIKKEERQDGGVRQPCRERCPPNRKPPAAWTAAGGLPAIILDPLPGRGYYPGRKEAHEPEAPAPVERRPGVGAARSGAGLPAWAGGGNEWWLASQGRLWPVRACPVLLAPQARLFVPGGVWGGVNGMNLNPAPRPAPLVPPWPFGLVELLC